MMEGIYSRARHLGKERRLRKYKESIREIQRKNKCRSKEARKDRYGRRKRF